MTALTGETGAGKSILLDALGLVLGERASVDSIQQDHSRADITATFNLDNLPDVVAWLIEQELDADNECIIRRTINTTGKSRATINDVPVSVQLLRQLGHALVNIHGQHAHQRLTKTAEQLELLDRYSGSDKSIEVKHAFQAWKAADADCEQYTQALVEREQRLDLISFQLREFDELALGTATVEDIESEHQWLANADRILSLSQGVLEALDDQAYPALISGTTPMTELVKFDQRLQEALDLVESAGIQVSEAAQSVRQLTNQLERDDARLQWLDQKLSTLHRLSRKHQCNINELSEIENQLRDEFDQLTAPAQSLDALFEKRDSLRKDYDALCHQLSSVRSKKAKQLARTISEYMQDLNMPGGRFEIQISSDRTEPSPQGSDSVQFLVSPNPGVKPDSMAKVASGGELSRIGLCLQLATLEIRSVPTLIFDEVDSGVGGAVAETVGRLLRRVGEKSQVLCVTHLPQVASQAHNHLMVSKIVTKGQTRTQVSALDAKATRDEIARMLGGKKITDKSRQHAQEMLDSVS